MNKEIIFIVGASSDIGIDLIKNINDDCIIIAHYHSSKAKITDAIAASSNQIIPISANLSKEDEVLKMLDTIEENYGVPTKIIHLAATRVKNIRFKSIKWEDFEQDIHVSVRSAVLIFHRFLPKLAKLKKGKIVMMLSSYVMGVPPKALAHYTTIKYAMLGLMKSLASEYATKNIQINAISPSMCETKFLENINSKIVELNAYHHPLKRNALVSDVTPIIKMLMSKESNYMNGVNIPITGGSLF